MDTYAIERNTRNVLHSGHATALASTLKAHLSIGSFSPDWNGAHLSLRDFFLLTATTGSNTIPTVAALSGAAISKYRQISSELEKERKDSTALNPFSEEKTEQLRNSSKFVKSISDACDDGSLTLLVNSTPWDTCNRSNGSLDKGMALTLRQWADWANNSIDVLSTSSIHIICTAPENLSAHNGASIYPLNDIRFYGLNQTSNNLLRVRIPSSLLHMGVFNPMEPGSPGVCERGRPHLRGHHPVLQTN